MDKNFVAYTNDQIYNYINEENARLQSENDMLCETNKALIERLEYTEPLARRCLTLERLYTQYYYRALSLEKYIEKQKYHNVYDCVNNNEINYIKLVPKKFDYSEEALQHYDYDEIPDEVPDECSEKVSKPRNNLSAMGVPLPKGMLPLPELN